MDPKQQHDTTDSMASMVSKVGAFSISHSASAQTQARADLDGLSFRFSGDRPPTNLGSRQGDHSRAYALIKHLVHRKCAGQPIDVAIKQLLHIASCYLYSDNPDEAHDISEKVKKEFDSSKYFIQADIDKLCGLLEKGGATKEEIEKSRLGWLMANTRGLELVFEELASHYLTHANQKALTAFPSEFSVEPPKGESARVVTALKFLDEIQSDNILDQDISEMVLNICHLFWYPRIPDSELYDPQNKDKVEKWGKVKNKYKKNTQPRDNNLDMLCQVMENYLVLIFECYPVLHAQQKDSLSTFIDFILDDDANTSEKVKFDWKLKGNEKEVVTITVKENLKSFHGFYENTQQGSRASRAIAVESDDDNDVLSQRTPSPQNLESDINLDETYHPRSTTSSDNNTPPGSDGESLNIDVKTDEKGNRRRITYEETLSNFSSTLSPR